VTDRHLVVSGKISCEFEEPKRTDGISASDNIMKIVEDYTSMLAIAYNRNDGDKLGCCFKVTC
jgi:hypothetical protein